MTDSDSVEYSLCLRLKDSGQEKFENFIWLSLVFCFSNVFAMLEDNEVLSVFLNLGE